MSLINKLLFFIKKKSSLQARRLHTEKELAKINEILVPKNQREFKEIFSLLYDLINFLPDVTGVTEKHLRMDSIRSDFDTSSKFHAAVFKFQNKDLTVFNPNNPTALRNKNKQSFQLRNWYSSKDILDTAFTQLTDLLEDAIELDTLLKRAEADIGWQHANIEELKERFSWYTSSEFKMLVLSALDILKFFTKIYYEDPNLHGKSKERR